MSIVSDYLTLEDAQTVVDWAEEDHADGAWLHNAYWRLEHDADVIRVVPGWDGPGFDFRVNGDVFDAAGNYLGRIDTDGDIRVEGGLPERETATLIRAELARQFAGRANSNWPEAEDWPVEFRRCLGVE